MAKDYQDSAFKRNSNFTVEQRQSVVRNLEILVNNVKISENKTSIKFNTSTIFYEVNNSNVKFLTKVELYVGFHKKTHLKIRNLFFWAEIKLQKTRSKWFAKVFR